MADFTLPKPKYTIWQAMNACLALSLRAVEEVRALAARPPVQGRPGKDGLGFDDLEQIEDGFRYGLRFVRGEQIKEMWWNKPTLADAYAGVWREGNFKRGQAASFGGSLFLCLEDTTDKPETSKAWVLVTKRGRDGKDGKDGVMRAPPGPVKIG